MWSQFCEEYDVKNDRSSVLKDERNHIEWWKKEGTPMNLARWDRYRDYLLESLPSSVVEEIDKSTDEIIGLLEDPSREGKWDTRGLVVGSVQSGKTSNYIGLINKALDAEYKLVIILAGLNNDLRSQTQIRVDEGLLGFDSANFFSGKSHIYIGVGKNGEKDDSKRLPFLTSLTNSSANGDFSKTTVSSLSLVPDERQIIAVIKKNTNTLEHIYKWLLTLAQNHMIDTRIIHGFFTKPFFRVLSSKCKQIFLDSVIHIVSGGGGYLIFSKMTGKNWSKSHITSFCA